MFKRRYSFLISFTLWLLLDPAAFSSQNDLPTLKNALTLTQIIELALQNNRNLISSVYSQKNAALSVEAARSEFHIKWAPSANAGFSQEEESDQQFGAGVLISKRFEFGGQASVGPGIGYSDDDYGADMSFSLAVPLLKGMGREVTLDPIFTAEQGLKDTMRRLYLSRVSIVIDTVSTVYRILQQKELVHLYESQIRSLEYEARLAAAKERAGFATPMDIYRAQLRTKDAQESLNRALEALKASEDRLKIILAIPPERTIDVDTPRKTEPIDIEEEKAVDIALLNRIEISQAKDDLKEAKRRAGIAKDATKPGLDLVLKYRIFNESESYYEAIQLDENAWSVNLVSSTDWTRKAEKAAYQQRLNAIKTAELQLESQEDLIKQDVRQQLEAIKKAAERIQIRKEQIRQAEGKLALSKIKFRYNLAGNFDLIEATTELQQAEVDHLAAQTDYIVGMYRLRASLGTLLERPEGI